MTHPDRPDRPDRPLLPGDVHDEDHLRRLLATAADTMPVGPPPVATMLRHHRVRRRSRLLVAAAVVVAGAGVGLATSVPFDGDPGPGAGATAASEGVADLQDPGDAGGLLDRESAITPTSPGADYDAADTANEADALGGFSGRSGVLPRSASLSDEVAAAAALGGTWAIVPSVETAENGALAYGLSATADAEDLQGRLSTTPTAATLYFGDGGTVTAWTGCEAGVGTWSVAGGTVSVELSRGVPLCDDDTGLLALLADDLRSVRAVGGDDGTRTLLDEDGRVLAVLRRP